MSEPMDMREEVELPLLPKPIRTSEFWDEGIEWAIAGERAARLERERQLKAALSANKQKDAETELLRERYRSLSLAVGKPLHSSRAAEHYARKLSERAEKAEAELTSLRASAGEKWIEIKEGCKMPKDEVTVLVYAPYWRCLPFPAYIEHGRWHGEGILSLPSSVTHWQPLPAPPSLPTEKE